MKKIITLSCFSLSVVALVCILGTQTSCHKDTTDCPCVITVKDTNSAAVAGATVKLFAPHGTWSQAEGTAITNSAGNVNFDFTLPAIFNIVVTKGLALNDTLKGSGIIQLQIGQSVSATVTIK